MIKQNRWRRLLRSAANLLERSGWHQGSCFVGENGFKLPVQQREHACSFCMVGAMGAVAKLPDIEHFESESSLLLGNTGDPVYDKAYREVSRVIINETECTAIKPYHFNDRVGMTKEQVVAKLREVANKD